MEIRPLSSSLPLLVLLLPNPARRFRPCPPQDGVAGACGRPDISRPRLRALEALRSFSAGLIWPSFPPLLRVWYKTSPRSVCSISHSSKAPAALPLSPAKDPGASRGLDAAQLFADFSFLRQMSKEVSLSEKDMDVETNSKEVEGSPEALFIEPEEERKLLRKVSSPRSPLCRGCLLILDKAGS